MGWGIVLALAAVALAMLWRFGAMSRAALDLSGAAILLGVAGYAWQGRPAQPGISVQPRDKPGTLDPATVESRRNMMGQFGGEAQWLDYADTMTRMGQTQMAVLAMRSGLRDNPKSPELWIGLGNALIAHGNGLVSPAAEFAFRRAQQLSPTHPGPPLFLGIALVQQGRANEAAAMWRALLARTPPDAPWRADVEGRLAAIEGATP